MFINLYHELDKPDPPEHHLPYDVCRCQSHSCVKKERCLRYTDTNYGPRTPVSYNLCDGSVIYPFFIGAD